jgi:hypothetical protein
LEAGHVQALRAGDELVARRGRGSGVAGRQLDLDQHGKELARPQTVVADGPQPPRRRGPGQLEVAPGEVQASGRQQGLDVTLLPQQEHLGLGQPTLPDPQLGEGDGRVPARHPHGILEVPDGAGEHLLRLTPSAQLAVQRRLNGVAVVGDKDRDTTIRTHQPMTPQDVGP